MASALHHDPRDGPTAIVLSGGGARAAYQVGVLQALSRLRQNAGADHEPTPFPIAVGTSAGAINAAGLACGADHFDRAVQRLSRVWRNFSTSQVYRADAFGVARSGARWLSLLTLGWALTRWHYSKPRSLLDNTPLLQLLQNELPLEKLPHLLHSGQLAALAISASSYTTGEHVTFYEAGPHVPSWSRMQRRALQDRITHQHLMASSSIPFIFAPTEISIRGQYNYLGDGAMRQTAPLAPAVHLGAKRIVVVGVGRSHEVVQLPQGEHPPFPSLAQVAGHALSTIFLDALSLDVERAQRINHTLSLIPPAERERAALRPVDLLVFTPSQSLDAIALAHLQDLPTPVRALLAAVGVSAHNHSIGSAALASYLLFEPGYTRALIALGRADTMARQDEVRAFFGWPERANPPIRLSGSVNP
ncbi:patatin-like phospholipase family protein [Comamonas sp. J-3]|uniref:patatin-like phospholipase family protein n=1 Tax=Comamonas trifloxystrobinivorans TaxID=3350256 RepID=UPI00372AB33D